MSAEGGVADALPPDATANSDAVTVAGDTTHVSVAVASGDGANGASVPRAHGEGSSPTATELRRESVENAGEMMSISIVEFQRFQMELVELKGSKYEWGEQQRRSAEELRKRDEEIKRRDEEAKRRDEEIRRRDEEIKRRDEDLKRRADELKKKDEEMRKKEEEAKKQLQRRDDDLKKKAEEIKKKDDEIRKKDDEAKRLKKDLQQAQKDLASAAKDDGKGAGAAAKARMDTLLRDYRELEREFEAAKAAHAEEKASLRQAIKTLAGENDDLRARVNAAESATSLIFAASAEDQVGPVPATPRRDGSGSLGRTESGFEAVTLLATPEPVAAPSVRLSAPSPSTETEPSTHGSPDGSMADVAVPSPAMPPSACAGELCAHVEEARKEKERAEAVQAELAAALGRLESLHNELSEARAAVESERAGKAAMEEEAHDARTAAEALRSQLSATSTECALTKTDLSAVRDELRVRDDELANINIRLKWTQNKLQAEQDALAQTKAALDKATKRANELREECDGIRANYTATVEALQAGEKTHQGALEDVRKDVEAASARHARELADLQDLAALRAKETEEWRTRHAELLSRHDLVLRGLEVEKRTHGETQSALADAVAKYTSVQEALETAQRELTDLRGQADNRHALAEEARLLRRELEAARIDASNTAAAEYDARRQLEEALAEKAHISSTLATLEVRAHALEKQRASLEADVRRLTVEVSEGVAKLKAAEESLAAERSSASQRLADAARSLAAETAECERLRAELEHEEEQRKISERKSQMALKDLQRQLKQERNRVVELEGGTRSPIGSTGSVHSSSFVVVDQEAAAAGVAISGRYGHSRSHSDGNDAMAAVPPLQPPPAGRRKGSLLSQSYVNDAMSSSMDTVDQGHVQGVLRRGSEVAVAGNSWEALPAGASDAAEAKALARRVAQLQKEVNKRDERIKFFEEHTRTLVDDIRRKTKVIQDYAMRDEAGALAPPTSDAHKMQRARDRGIMASLFSLRPHDSKMTLELSLEICAKLQSLLEDSLLKNIQLQENIDTLGNEIARLQGEMPRATTAS